MTETIYPTEAERLLMDVIQENPAFFSEGIVDWNNVRDYAIQVCAERNLTIGKKTPIQQACMANGVNRTYYYKANIAKKRFV